MNRLKMIETIENEMVCANGCPMYHNAPYARSQCTCYKGDIVKQLLSEIAESEPFMIGMTHLQKIREYCDYVEEHLVNVQKAWEIIKVACRGMNIVYDDHLYHTIDLMIRYHDVSKMSQQEFIPYQRKFFPVEEACSNWFADAWEHHKRWNSHHWENWTTMKMGFPNEWACHCTCMICDWMAMGMVFGDTAQEYYEKNKEKIKLPEYAIRFMYEIFNRISERKVCDG